MVDSLLTTSVHTPCIMHMPLHAQASILMKQIVSYQNPTAHYQNKCNNSV